MSIDNALAMILEKIPAIVQYAKANPSPTTTINEKRIVQARKVEAKIDKVKVKHEKSITKPATPLYNIIDFKPEISHEAFLKAVIRTQSENRKEEEIKLIKQYVGTYQHYLDHTGQLNAAISKAKTARAKEQGEFRVCRNVSATVSGYSAASDRNAIAAEGIKTKKLRAEQFLFSISNATTVGEIARACRRIDNHEAADRVLSLSDCEAKTIASIMVKEVEKEVQEYTKHLASLGM